MQCNENNYIQRLKKGKEDALDYIVDNYLPLVKGTVLKILTQFKDDGLVEECINDVFISIWNNANKFHGDNTDFKKWIYSVSKFKAIDYYRSKVRKGMDILETIELIDRDCVEDRLIQSENRKEIINLINELDSVDRNIFILKFFLGYTSEDIALKLGITKAAVDNRIYRGKRKLKEKVSSLKLEVI